MDKFKIGDMEVTPIPSYGLRGYWVMRHRHATRIGRKPKLIYSWDCAAGISGNPAPPKSVKFPSIMSFDVIHPRSGRINAGASARNREDFLRRSGLKTTDALGTELAKVFGATEIPLNWVAASFQMNDGMKAKFYAWPDFADVYIRAANSYSRAIYMISLPVSAQVQGIVHGFCSGWNPPFLIDPNIISLPSGAKLPKPTATEAEQTPSERLRRVHDEEQARMRKKNPKWVRDQEARVRTKTRNRQIRLFDREGAGYPEGEF